MTYGELEGLDEADGLVDRAADGEVVHGDLPVDIPTPFSIMFWTVAAVLWSSMKPLRQRRPSNKVSEDTMSDYDYQARAEWAGDTRSGGRERKGKKQTDLRIPLGSMRKRPRSAMPSSSMSTL